jgi:CRP/FNR family cyclic AMP-dependent transcriptional regulator
MAVIDAGRESPNLARRHGRGLASMAIDTVVASLLRLPIFAGLKPLQVTEVARRGVHSDFRRGQLITRAGASGDAAYLVLSGDADFMSERGAHPEPIAPGSLLGELAMLVDHVYGVTAMARGPVHCLKLTRAAMHEQMQEDPDVAKRLARVMRERLTRVAHELREINQLLEECEDPAGYPGARAPLKVPDMRGWTANEKRPTPGEELGARSASCA